jgi:hypothetical protein
MNWRGKAAIPPSTEKLLLWHKLTVTAGMPKFAKICGAEALVRITDNDRSNWAEYRNLCDDSIMRGVCNYFLSECRNGVQVGKNPPTNKQCLMIPNPLSQIPEPPISATDTAAKFL